MSRVAVIGVGKVGLPLACHLSDIGHTVFVHDKDQSLLTKIAEGKNPFPWENGIHSNLRVARSMEKLCFQERIEAFFIVTPTPEIGGVLSSGPVLEVIAVLEEYLFQEQSEPLPGNIVFPSAKPEPMVVVVSTLDPRDAATVCRPRKAVNGRRLKMMYSPPLIRLGEVKGDFASPNIIFLGSNESDAESLQQDLWNLYHPEGHTWPNGKIPTEVEGDVTSIACAKLAINASLSLRAAWANDVAERAANLGAKNEIVFRAISAEPRIGGTSYMLPGAPPAGPCLPRDMETWASLHGSDLPKKLKELHQSQLEGMVRAGVEFVLKTRQMQKSALSLPGLTVSPSQSMTVGIVGLGYKIKGPDITNAVGFNILFNLIKVSGGAQSLRILAHDDVSGPVAQKVIGEGFNLVNLDDACNADVVLLCLDYPGAREKLHTMRKTTFDLTFQKI